MRQRLFKWKNISTIRNLKVIHLNVIYEFCDVSLENIYHSYSSIILETKCIVIVMPHVSLKLSIFLSKNTEFEHIVSLMVFSM